MRMPRFADLDDEQRKVYQGAPPDGSILVTGPPGTGKTVMAFHRATYLKKAGQEPRVIMYNSVLSEYVGQNNTHSGGIGISTMHKWLSSWFASLGLGKAPELERWVPDWMEILKRAHPLLTNGKAAKVNWGHLVVDEGQDFPPAMYHCLAGLLLSYPPGGANRPALTVFADENQRIWENNSTIADIQRVLALTGEKRVFALTKNYRNTRQIAAFTARFYCGLRTGIPAMPTREGPKPTVSLHRGQPAMIESIIAFIESTWDLDISIGIICPKDKTRKRIYSQLCEEYEGNEDIVIQSFSSKKDADLPAKSLKFDIGSTVTVICLESAKGLEFDAVLVIDPFLRASAAASGEQQFKMNMYVACSRARQHLRLLFVSDREMVMSILPPKADGLYELVEA